MTVCHPDTTPTTWHKIGFSSAYLGVVGRYIKEHGVNAQISGAISFGVLGPAPSKVSFENKDDFDAFVEWFEVSDEKPIRDGIFIGDSDLFAKTFPVSEVPEGRGSKVTELPKGEPYDPLNIFEEKWAETKVKLTEGNPNVGDAITKLLHPDIPKMFPVEQDGEKEIEANERLWAEENKSRSPDKD